MKNLQSEFMSVEEAEERLVTIRECDDVVEFLRNTTEEVKLAGTFNVDDLEALLVLMLWGPIERPDKSGAQS